MTGYGAAGCGWSVLLVEDDPMIALELEHSLFDIGAEGVESVATVGEALRRLEGRRFDVGLLDFEVGKERITPVMSRMRELGIPFVLSSGHEELELGAGFDDAQTLAKPFGLNALEGALAKAMG